MRGLRGLMCVAVVSEVRCERNVKTKTGNREVEEVSTNETVNEEGISFDRISKTG